MEYERKIVTLICDANLPAKAAEFQAEGWDINPDAPPVITYYLQRPVGAKAASPFANAKLIIDDDKVFIRAADGTIRKN